MKPTRIIEKLDPRYDFTRLTNEADIVIDDIIKRLSIPKGSYVFDPEVGSDLFNYIFELSDDEIYSEVEQELRYIINSTQKAVLNNIDISFTADRKGLIIDIFLTIITTQQKAKVTILATGEYISLMDMTYV